MKRLIVDICCRRRPPGDATRVHFGKSALRFAERSVYSTIICALFASSAFAQADTQFARANQEYAQGQFKEAITDYEALVNSGEWSAPLFYDLGNAYFRSGDFGRAILNYERALALDPHHPESAANLRIARDEARALELQQSRLERYLRFGTLNQYAVAAAAAFWIAAFLIAGLIFARRRSLRFVTLAIATLATFALSIAAIVAIDNGSKGRALGIVTGDGVDARVATADTANSILTLPRGSAVRVLSKRGDWLYAALPNNLRGWIPAKSVEPVRL